MSGPVDMEVTSIELYGEAVVELDPGMGAKLTLLVAKGVSLRLT